jgi:hypothetical protein
MSVILLEMSVYMPERVMFHVMSFHVHMTLSLTLKLCNCAVTDCGFLEIRE